MREAEPIHLPRSGTLRRRVAGLPEAWEALGVCVLAGPPTDRAPPPLRDAGSAAAPPNAPDWEVNVRARQTPAHTYSAEALIPCQH